MCIYIYIYIYIYTYIHIYTHNSQQLTVRKVRSGDFERSAWADSCFVFWGAKWPRIRVGEILLSGGSKAREGGSAPKRGRHSTIFLSTKCICAVAVWCFDNPHQKVVPRSRIPRSTSHFSHKGFFLVKGGLAICVCVCFLVWWQIIRFRLNLLRVHSLWKTA